MPTATSQNGWSANDRSKVSSRLVPGTSVRLTVRNGAPGDLLLEIAGLFDRLVQDIDNARGALDDWGYAERPIRGSTTTSNHASGTAIDVNATRWPLGRPPSVNLNATQIATVRRIVGAANGVVVWGGEWKNRPDPMHFELARRSTEAQCAAALTALRRAFGGASTPTPTPIPAPLPAPLPAREDDLMTDIQLPVADDGTFRRMVKVEAGGYGTQVADVAVVTLGVDRGGAHFMLTARGPDGKPFRPDPSWDGFDLPEAGHWGWQIPEGTRSLVIEGHVDGAAAQPCAAIFHRKD